MSEFIKDPNADLDYKRDWSAWLPAGDTIATSTWVVPAGLTSRNPTHNATSATIWLAGGTVDQSYLVTNHIVTAAGRVDDRTFTVVIRQL